jgi:hypothetical protein
MGENSMSSLAILPRQNPFLYLVEPQLVPTVAFERLPWLQTAFHRLDELQLAGRDIPGVGDLRISAETTTVVRRLLSHVTNGRLPVPEFAPISGGGVGVTWNWRDKEISFKIFPGDEEIIYVVTNDRDRVIEDGVFTIGRNDAMRTALSHLIEG